MYLLITITACMQLFNIFAYASTVVRAFPPTRSINYDYNIQDFSQNDSIHNKWVCQLIMYGFQTKLILFWACDHSAKRYEGCNFSIWYYQAPVPAPRRSLISKQVSDLPTASASSSKPAVTPNTQVNILIDVWFSGYTEYSSSLFP